MFGDTLKTKNVRKLFYLTSILLFTFCSNQQKKINPKIEIIVKSIESIIDVYSEIEIVADSILLPEGPVWHNDSKSLFFTDVISNKVLKWNKSDGVSDYLFPSGNTGYAPNFGKGILGANGLTIDEKGSLILCQHGDRRIASIRNLTSKEKNLETVIDNYDGKRLNSPNDLTISKKGEIYFTDPPFVFFDLDSFKFRKTEMKELDFNGVYKYNPKSNEITLISKEIQTPNGIGLTPDETYLYVNQMGKPFSDSESQIKKIDLKTMKVETFFEGKELVDKFNDGKDFDGMVVHSSGNIFTSGPGGLLVISPEGELQARIDFGHITNCTLDTNENYLYVTGFLDNPKVYRIKLK